MRRITAIRRALACALVLSGPASLAAQNAAVPTPQGESHADPGAKKILGLADIGRWNRINSAALSANGKWMTYVYAPMEGDGTLYIRQLDGEKRYTVPVGSAPQFSDDSRYAGYFVSPPEATGRAGRGGRGAPGGGGRGRGAQPAGRRRPHRRDTSSCSTLRPATRIRCPTPRHSSSRRARSSLPFARTRRTPRRRTTAPTSCCASCRAASRRTSATSTCTTSTTTAAHARLHDRRRRPHRQRRVRRRPGDESVEGAQLRRAGLRPVRVEPEGHVARRASRRQEKGEHAAGQRARRVAERGRRGGAGRGVRSRQGRGLPDTATSSASWRRRAGRATGRASTSASKNRNQRGTPQRPSRRPTSTCGTGRTPRSQSVQIVRLAQERRATLPAVFNVAGNRLVRIADDDDADRDADGRSALGDRSHRHDLSRRGRVGRSHADYYRVNTETAERSLDRQGSVADDGIVAGRRSGSSISRTSSSYAYNTGDGSQRHCSAAATR